MKTLVIFIFLFSGCKCVAQDSINNKHHPIYFKAFSGWKQDGHRLNGKALKTELYKVPMAIPFYKKARSYYKASLLTYFPMLTLAYLGSKRSKTYPYNYKNGFTIAGMITAGATVYLLTKYKKNIKKAVKLYNEY